MAELAGRPRYEGLDACVLQEMGRWTVPGVAVGIWQDGSVETNGFGVTSLETRQPVTGGTLFQIGSITKVYTATLIMRLVEAGKLDLDAPVVAYLPELRLADASAREQITLRHLLSHTSGLEGDRFTDYGPGDDALSKAIAEFQTLRQVTPPAETWSYCNAGFYLAGAIVERVTGQTVEAVTRHLLLTPLGAERTFFFAHEAIAYPVAVGHNQLSPEAAPEVARRYPLPRCVNAAGSLISTVGDLLRFASLHLNRGTIDGSRLLSEQSVRSMQQVVAPAANFADAYGVGWALRSVGGRAIVEHGGSTNGFRAQLTLVPDAGFAIAILTNGSRGHAANAAIVDWALDHFWGIRAEEPERVCLAPADLARFAGNYRHALASLTISVEGDGLRVESVRLNPFTNEENPAPPFTLLPIAPFSAREFIVTDGDGIGGRVDFPGEDGSVPRFVRIGGRLADRVE